MESQLSKFDVNFERFPAVDGKTLDSKFVKNAKAQHKPIKHYPSLNFGEIGLIKSYFDLFELISKQKKDYAIILEDDVLIDSSLFEELENILNLITPNDFIDISGNKGFSLVKNNGILNLYAVPPKRTTGQILGNKAAEKLSFNLKTYDAPIDVMLQEVSRHQVNVFNTKKSYVKHSADLVGGTTIQNKKLLRIKKITRELIRPFWQLYSIIGYKFCRYINNVFFYKKNLSQLVETDID
jgi:glycosyl transferase family 25